MRYSSSCFILFKNVLKILTIAIIYQHVDAIQHKELIRSFNLIRNMFFHFRLQFFDLMKFLLFFYIKVDFNIVCLYNNEQFKLDNINNIENVINKYCNYHIFSYDCIDFDHNGSFRFVNEINLIKEIQM